jgi:predicted PurR-regulated permease PerM
LAQQRDAHVPHQTGDVLRRWLIGKGIAMTVIGGMTYIGLLIAACRFPSCSRCLRALLGFFPILDRLSSSVPMVLVAGGDSLHLAIWVVCLYALVQLVESYLLTPLIEACAVSLPPRRGDPNQHVLGALFGILGLALATPLAVAAIVPPEACSAPKRLRRRNWMRALCLLIFALPDKSVAALRRKDWIDAALVLCRKHAERLL